MSKSFGNVIDPFKLLETHGEEAIRIYFLSEGPEYYDSEYDELVLKKRYNDLIESFGYISLFNFYFIFGLVNALNRVFQKKIIKNGEIPCILLNFTAEESKLIEEFNNSTKIMQNLMENFLIRKSFLVIQEKCDVINKFIGKTEVWKVRDETTKNKIIYIILEMIRITSLLLESFVPSLSANILNALQIKENHRKVENLMFRSFKTKDENFHHEKDQNIFLKVNLDDKTNFFRKKFDVVKN